jgi:hypothetical protein
LSSIISIPRNYYQSLEKHPQRNWRGTWCLHQRLTWSLQHWADLPSSALQEVSTWLDRIHVQSSLKFHELSAFRDPHSAIRNFSFLVSPQKWSGDDGFLNFFCSLVDLHDLGIPIDGLGAFLNLMSKCFQKFRGW